MAKRVTSDAYKDCPLCGRKPFIKYSTINTGVIYCNGRLFKKHRIIAEYIDYSQPSQLSSRLLDKWNNFVDEEECANLPVY